MTKILFPIAACAILMAASLVTNSISDEHKKNARNPLDIYTGDISDLKNFTLNTSLPTGTPEMKIYRVGVPQYSRAWCEGEVETRYPGWLDENVEVEQTTETYIQTVFRKGMESISVDKTGLFEYSNETASLKMITVRNEILMPQHNDTNATVPDMLSRDEAYSLSVQYVETHGGFPAGYFSFHNSTTIATHDGQTINFSYIFNFVRRINEYPVIGGGVLIMMTPLGDVSFYTALWRDMKDVKRTVKVVSVARALEYLDKNGYVYERMPIEKIELGYYSGEHRTVISEMVPVWIFYTDIKHTDYRVVDAAGLTFGG